MIKDNKAMSAGQKRPFERHSSCVVSQGQRRKVAGAGMKPLQKEKKVSTM